MRSGPRGFRRCLHLLWAFTVPSVWERDGRHPRQGQHRLASYRAGRPSSEPRRARGLRDTVRDPRPLPSPILPFFGLVTFAVDTGSRLHGWQKVIEAGWQREPLRKHKAMKGGKNSASDARIGRWGPIEVETLDNLGVGWCQSRALGTLVRKCQADGSATDTGGHSAPGLVAISGGLGVQKQRKAHRVAGHQFASSGCHESLPARRTQRTGRLIARANLGTL